MALRMPNLRAGLLALAVLAGAPAFAQSAAIASTNPATLDYGNLRTAWIAVNLTGATYENAADTFHFTLNTTIPDLTVDRLWFNGGRTGAILYLRWDGSDFNSAATIGVTVAAAATTHTAALTTTNTAAVSPARWVNVSAKTVALAEGGRAASYTVALRSPPTATTTVTVASDNAAVTVGGAASTTLTFTATNWATAQSVSVAPVDDNADTVDELALVTNVATGGGYVSSAVANRTVRVTVADDDARTGTDYDADDDQLIEIDSLAKLNAVRWDLDGNGTPAPSATTSYAAAFPGAAAGMGCPDSGDADALGNCAGYELTADLDFDTNGNGRTHTDGVGDDGDAYYNGGAGWEPIGNNVSPPSNFYDAVFRGNGHVISNLFVNAAEGSATNYVGLFGIISDTRIESLGLRDGHVRAMRAFAGVLAGASYADVVGCYSTGTVSVGATHHQYAQTSGGLFGAVFGGYASLAASYSIARVSTDVCGDRQCARIAGGLLAQANTIFGSLTIDNSWAAGPVNRPSVNTGGLLGQVIGGSTFTANASYYDTQTTGWTTSHGGVGLDTTDLQQPTGYIGIYAYWDDVDLDGDGRVDADEEDAWDFGTWSQYPSLKWGGFDVTKQFAGLLSFRVRGVGQRFVVGRPIALFEVPAAVGGEGTVRYSARGLPPGLWFDADGRGQCGLARSVCGTPSEEGSWTATVTAHDGAGATAPLTLQVAVVAEGDAGPPAVVPDAALRAAVARALGVEASSLTEADLLALSSLSAPWSGVSSLAGLSAASNLRRLELGGNALADLSELSGRLRLLEHLDLSDNAVSDISALSGLTRLETLLLSGNQVSDLSPLRGMAGLRSLFLDGNAVEDLSPLVFLESLEELSLSGNPLGELSPLCALRKLKRLWLAASGLSDLSELSCLTGLEQLWLADNAVENVGPLRGMRALEWLDLERNAVSDVAPLRRLNSLTRLRLGSNGVSDAGPLAANEGLGEGDVAGLRGNPLSEESIQLHVPALRERGATVLAGLSAPWFASAGDADGRQSFVRLVNRSDVAGEALVWGVDAAGERFGPARLAIGAGRTAHFNSEDLEFGNAAKGLADGLGAPTAGNWRLEVLSTLDLEAQTFLRASGGPPSALHDGLPRVGGALRAAFLPAGRERSPAGALRVAGATPSSLAWRDLSWRCTVSAETAAPRLRRCSTSLAGWRWTRRATSTSPTRTTTASARSTPERGTSRPSSARTAARTGRSSRRLRAARWASPGMAARPRRRG